MATIKKVELANGETRWRVRMYVGRDPDTGKQEVITRTFEKKRDADAEVTRLKAMQYKGGVITPTKEPLGKYLKNWLHKVKKHTLQPRTYDDYCGVLKRYIEDPPAGAPPIGKIPLNRLTVDAIQDLYAFLQEHGLARPGHRCEHGLGVVRLERHQVDDLRVDPVVG